MEDISDIKKWAPVLIPTLCRFDHFKQLIESLDECIGACYTDVYVALDYPAKDAHKKGWIQIKTYLANKSFKFRKFILYERKYNYGVNENGNLHTLCKDVFPYYGSYIISEDDNIFSKNFLIYINRGLQKFKDDKSVLSICGYSFFYNLKFDKNNFFRNQQDFNAWGYAIWRDRQNAIDAIDYNYFRSKLWDFYSLKKVWDAGPVLFSHFLAYTRKKSFKKADYCYGLYMILENKHQIMPRISKVQNMGWDNTGLNCNNYPKDIAEKHLNQPIDESESFEYIGTGFEFFDENRMVIKNEDFNKKYASNFKNLCKLILLQFRIIK